jgi:hypothetical protein
MYSGSEGKPSGLNHQMRKKMARHQDKSVQGSKPKKGLEARGAHFYQVTVVGKKLLSNQIYRRFL